MVRALASHQCGPGSIPGPGAIYGLSLLLVLSLLREVFLRVLRFSPLLKNQHCQIPNSIRNARTHVERAPKRALGVPWVKKFHSHFHFPSNYSFIEVSVFLVGVGKQLRERRRTSRRRLIISGEDGGGKNRWMPRDHC